MNGERKLFTLTRATDSDDGLIVVSIEGELDLSVTDDFSAAIDAQTDTECNGVVLDMEGVTFIDSSSLHAVLLANEKLKGDGIPMRLIASDRSAVAKVLELSGLLQRVDRSPTLDEARKSIV